MEQHQEEVRWAVLQTEQGNILKFSGDNKGLSFYTWSWANCFRDSLT